MTGTAASFETGSVVERAAGISTTSAIAAILKERREILRRTDASHDAVLVPREPGGISHAERAALALRIVRRNQDAALAGHYQALLDNAGWHRAADILADPDAAAPQDRRLAAMVRHVDILTRQPQAASRDDIAALRAAGLDDPDIVRLTQLAAFVNFQLRLVAGLRLLARGQ